MKAKTIALVGIAVVLCSVLLVATLPATAIAAEQTTQKVSASTITAASEDDYVLDIYGNANEDVSRCEIRWQNKPTGFYSDKVDYRG